MKTTSKEKKNINLSANYCIGIIVVILINTAYMRFRNYDSPSSLLNPDYYSVEVITEEDYKQISNLDNRSVTLSNGTILTREDDVDSFVLSNYKSIGNNDSLYILVLLRGNAPFMDKWYSGVLPILAFCIVGFFLSLKRKNN